MINGQLCFNIQDRVYFMFIDNILSIRVDSIDAGNIIRHFSLKDRRVNEFLIIYEK